VEQEVDGKLIVEENQQEDGQLWEEQGCTRMGQMVRWYGRGCREGLLQGVLLWVKWLE